MPWGLEVAVHLLHLPFCQMVQINMWFTLALHPASGSSDPTGIFSALRESEFLGQCQLSHSERREPVKEWKNT